MPRDLRIASISAISSSIGGWLGPDFAPPFLAGKAALDPDWELTSLLLAAEDRRPMNPPTTHSTMQRPSNDRPNHTAGEKMILDAQVPSATAAFHSNLRRPLKYSAIGASAKPMP